MFLAAWVLLVLAVPPLAQADIRSPSAVTVAAKADDALVLAIQEAKADIDNTDLKHAMQVLKTVRKRQDFEAAASPLRHGVILMIAGLAADAEDWSAATEAIVVASEMPDAVAVDWTLRLDIAGPTDAPEEALRSLTVLAQRFPPSSTPSATASSTIGAIAPGACPMDRPGCSPSPTPWSGRAWRPTMCSPI
ncbi:hypothetical protein CSW58_04460 [Caulobacter sp. B11]|nr:hypothetical protein CSW58_04460 [Caulobacter sp. B11]